MSMDNADLVSTYKARPYGGNKIPRYAFDNVIEILEAKKRCGDFQCLMNDDLVGHAINAEMARRFAERYDRDSVIPRPAEGELESIIVNTSQGSFEVSADYLSEYSVNKLYATLILEKEKIGEDLKRRREKVVKIIGKDNYGRDNVSDFLIADNVSRSYAESVIKFLQERVTGDDSTWPVIVDIDYKLYEWKP